MGTSSLASAPRKIGFNIGLKQPKGLEWNKMTPRVEISFSVDFVA
jgi:hypothetical protein